MPTSPVSAQTARMIGNDEKTGGEKREADDIGFARAPVAIEKRGGALPIDIARAMHTTGLSEDQISHRAWR